MTERKLGKKAGVVHDPRSLMLAAVFDPSGMPPVPQPWRIAAKLHQWPVFANDEIGDCTCASGGGHRVMAQEWSSGRRDKIAVSEGDVVELYSAVTGYRPGDPSTDNGAYLIDVLRYLRTYGFGREADGSPHTIGAYAKIDLGNRSEVLHAAHLFGGLYLGLALPLRADRQISAGEAWSVPFPPGAEDEPYSWGGHAVWMVGADAKGVTLVTWGQEQRATWAWFETYCDEAWALMSEDFVNRLGRTPQGFDVDRLSAFLGRL